MLTLSVHELILMNKKIQAIYLSAGTNPQHPGLIMQQSDTLENL